MSDSFTIERLGNKADGIAFADGEPVFVPFTLPGETVRAERKGARARLLTVDVPSPDRQDAPCPHFGTCGGCAIQHAGEEFYRAFKRDQVVDALRREKLDADVGPLVPCSPASRRRAVFSALRVGNRVLFGFHEAMTHRIVPLQVCLVVLPELARRLGVLERLAALLIDRRKELRMTVTQSLTGLDIAIEDCAALTPKLRQAATAMAVGEDFARLTVAGETLIELRPPQIDIGGIAVLPPPGSFLQAVASAEDEMARVALDHLVGSKQVADLFCGVGAFALRLARHHAVHAVEADAPALAALDRARRTPAGLKPLTSERRDLFRRPLTAKELARFDGVLFDPPRAGAEAQSRELAGSSVKRIAAVSCNPTTLARDARILVEGGYRLKSVTPIDQFLWSHHVEAVALFER